MSDSCQQPTSAADITESRAWQQPAVAVNTADDHAGDPSQQQLMLSADACTPAASSAATEPVVSTGHSSLLML